MSGVQEYYPLSYHVDYALELRNGGAGIGFIATQTASAPVPISVQPGDVIAFSVASTADADVWFRIGDSGVQATLGSMWVGRGCQGAFTVPRDGGTYTHISVITEPELTARCTANFSSRGS